MKLKPLLVLLILALGLFSFSIPDSPFHSPIVAAQTASTPKLVQSASSVVQPLHVEANSSSVEVNGYALFGGTAGYNELYNSSGAVLFYNEQLVLQYQASNGNWKQIGTPVSISWTNSSDYNFNVTRFYSNSLGTTYNITYAFNSGAPTDISIKLQSGQADTFRVDWVFSGITYLNSVNGTNSLSFSDSASHNLTLNWQDVATSFGNITTSSITTGSQGRDLEIDFGIGNLTTGQTLLIDPTLVQSAQNYCDGTNSCAVSFTSNVSSGDLIVVLVSTRTVAADVSSVSDSRTPSFADAVTEGGGSYNSSIWYGVSTSSGSDTVTIDFSTSTYDNGIVIMEISGGAVLGNTGTGTGTGTSYSTSSVSFPSGSFLVSVVSGGCTSITTGSGFLGGTFSTGSCGYEYDATGTLTSPTTFPMTGVSTTYYYSGAAFISSVTLPIQCNMKDGATAQSVTISGGSPSPSSLSCDGASHNITINPSASYTLSTTSATSTLRYILNVTSGTSCSSVTCSTVYLANYPEYNFTLAYSVNSGTPAAPSLTATQYGTSYTPAITKSYATYWLDNNTAWSLPHPNLYAGANEKWNSSQTLAGTVSASKILNATYQEYYNVTLLASPSTDGSTSPSGPTWQLSNSVITIKALYSNPPYALNQWTSKNASYLVIGNIHLVSTTLTITGYGFVYANYSIGNFYNLTIKLTEPYTGLSNPPGNETLTYYQKGSAIAFMLGTDYQTVWVDRGSTISLTNNYFWDLKFWTPSVLSQPINSNTTLDITYGTGTTYGGCSSGNAFTLLLNGCLFPLFVNSFSAQLGSFGMGFLLMVIDITLYTKNENPLTITLLMVVEGSILGLILPQFFLPLASIFVVVGLMGSVYQLIRNR